MFFWRNEVCLFWIFKWRSQYFILKLRSSDKVWVFWEGHKIWKNLCHTFDKSVMFCARNSVLFKKSTKIFQNKCGQVVLYILYRPSLVRIELTGLHWSRKGALRLPPYPTPAPTVLPAWGFPTSWMLENSGQNRLSLMTDVKFSGNHELENPEPVALFYSKQIGKIPVRCVGSGCLIYANTYLDIWNCV